MKFAAIDIGSNASRLLISEVFIRKNLPVFQKISFVRVPIRLGFDAFSTGKISEANSGKLLNTMIAFEKLMEVNEVNSYKAVATSAMRDAINGAKIASRIKKLTNLNIEIVDGESEAEIIFANRISNALDHKNAYLYINIGGGSTELTLSVKNKKIASHSFNIGTIRILQGKISITDWKGLENWIKKNTRNFKPIIAIGTGGSINKIKNLSQISESDAVIPLKKLVEVNHLINSHNIQDRVQILNLNPDRADVIAPASEILITILKYANINKIIIPQYGVTDGILNLLFEEYKLNIANQ